jgi:hypothetical protein
LSNDISIEIEVNEDGEMTENPSETPIPFFLTRGFFENFPPEP